MKGFLPPQSLKLVVEGPGIPPKGKRQAIPLYMKCDVEAFNYFREHKAEIDAITGDALTIALPSQIEDGESSIFGDLFGKSIKDRRFPGLSRSDLPCFWLEDKTGGHAIIRLPSSRNDLNQCVRAMSDAAEQGKSVKEIKKEVEKALGSNNTSAKESFMSKHLERILASAFGVFFVAVMLVLAVCFPEPSPFQIFVFRVVLAIAAAGFGALTPGFLEVKVSNMLRAGGALAIFVAVYFFNPATLVLSAQ
ncbi:MAG: hypothetical protein PHE27_05890 [Alphaproteobacteria bacterium]|nr:hypothetical protein [Alphaproteobacteria bacterium]